MSFIYPGNPRKDPSLNFRKDLPRVGMFGRFDVESSAQTDSLIHHHLMATLLLRPTPPSHTSIKILNGFTPLSVQDVMRSGAFNSGGLGRTGAIMHVSVLPAIFINTN